MTTPVPSAPQLLAIQGGAVIGAGIGLLVGLLTSDIGSRGIECALGRIAIFMLLGAILGAAIGLVTREGVARFAPQQLPDRFRQSLSVPCRGGSGDGSLFIEVDR